MKTGLFYHKLRPYNIFTTASENTQCLHPEPEHVERTARRQATQGLRSAAHSAQAPRRCQHCPVPCRFHKYANLTCPCPQPGTHCFLRRCLGWRGPGRAPAQARARAQVYQVAPQAGLTADRGAGARHPAEVWAGASTHLAPTHPLRRGSERWSASCPPPPHPVRTAPAAVCPDPTWVGRAGRAWQAPHKPVKKIPAPLQRPEEHA